MRIGLIGAGAVAPLHSRAAGLLLDVELTAVCDLQPEAARLVAEPIGAAVFTDYRELIASAKVDAVIVNTPHALHREMTIAAIDAGLDVLVEKPMAVTLDDCDAMTSAAQLAGVTLRIGHIQHFLPDKRAAARAVARGDVGTVRLIHDYRTTDYRPGTRSPWFFVSSLSGGGAVMNIGAHCLDRVTWIGGAAASSVSAHTLHRFGVGVETDATISLGLTNGVQASVTIVSDAPQPADLITVVGDEGSVSASPSTGAWLRRNGHSEQLHEPSPDDIPEAFRLQLADFVAAVQGGPSAVGLQHSRNVVELVLATYASSATGGQTQVLDPLESSLLASEA